MSEQQELPLGVTDFGPSLREYPRRLCDVLRTYSERGKTLQEVSGPLILNRSVRVLQRYCRAGKIAFPDYTPLAMRPRKEPKREAEPA